MITYQTELLCEVVPEVSELLDMHYQELTLNKDKIKLKPIWSKYAALEAAGAFTVFTARDDAALVGYSAFFLNAHLHYEETMCAMNDVLFLHPDYRKGMTGIKLVKYSEKQLQARGVNKVTWHAKFDTNLIPILHRLGYKNEEIVLGKHF